MDSPHPYDQLTPDAVLDALSHIGLHGDGRLLALSSYENRVYQARLEDGGSVVAKFYRPGRWTDAQIAEEHALALELAEAGVPAVPPLVVGGATLHRHGGFGFSASPYRGGRRPELDDPEVLEWIGRFLARIHTVGAARPFAARPALDVHAFGTEPREGLLASGVIAPGVERAWADASARAIECIASRAVLERPAGQNASEIQRIRLHGDCHPGNILWTPVDEAAGTGGPHFVDLDDARTGPAVQDLWMLLSGDRQQQQRQLGALLDGYEQFRDFDRRELALIEPLRTLRLLHYSWWLSRRWADPIFPATFPWFGTDDYWRGQVDMLNEQIEAMAEPALVA